MNSIAEIGDDVGDVATRVGLLAHRRVEHRIDVGALSRQDLPAVEARGIAAQVPLADHTGVVAARLQQLRDGHAALSKRLNIVTPFRCEYWPVRIAARLGVQIELVTNTRVRSAPSFASRSRCGVWFTRDP